jgi:DNA-directed RNA polymerase subunit RPC12/RpoP
MNDTKYDFTNSLDIEPVEAYLCVECGALSEDTLGERLYECNECGLKYSQSNGMGKNGNVCPDCTNKFGSKVSDDTCTECQEGEIEKVEAVLCPECDELFELKDFEPHYLKEHPKKD